MGRTNLPATRFGMQWITLKQFSAHYFSTNLPILDHGVREVARIVPTTVPMLSPILLNVFVAFGAPCRARLALVLFVPPMWGSMEL